VSGTRLALKVDVDTHDGLARGVPVIAELLRGFGIVASFFVACGPDCTGRRLGRLLDPRFVAKLRRTRVVQVYGWRTLLSGTLLPARPVAAAFPELLRALVTAGHEVGVHGYNHARWQDRLSRLAAAEVRAEVERATEVYRRVLGSEPLGFAAPGWRCTAESLAAVDEAGFAYRSDTRGAAPYRPLVNGRAFRAPELPTTLPTLDEVYGRVATEPEALADFYVKALRADVLNVHTVHAEIEGGPHRAVLAALLARTQGTVRFTRLCDEARAAASAPVAVCSVCDGHVPGRSMPVALQGPPVSSASG
jgi:peptidoglycan/xylan/chitin deacetylase (PgdA/CDA1 family)